MERVVGVDPGREKCGVAVVDKARGILYQEVVMTESLPYVVGHLLDTYEAKVIVIGNGTSSKASRQRLQKEIIRPDVLLVCVDEYRTTDMAKIRYWQENPPHGWRKWLPTSMQVPPIPVDDYVAVILAERYLQNGGV